MKWIYSYVCVEILSIHIRIFDTNLCINAWVKNLTLCPIIVEEYINDQLKLLDTQVHHIPWYYSKNLVEWILFAIYFYKKYVRPVVNLCSITGIYNNFEILQNEMYANQKACVIDT